MSESQRPNELKAPDPTPGEVAFSVISRYTPERWAGTVSQSAFENSRTVFTRLESNMGPRRALGLKLRVHDGWVEGVVANCLASCPIGYQEVQIIAGVRGGGRDKVPPPLHLTEGLFREGRWVGLADQTGYAFVVGDPSWDYKGPPLTIPMDVFSPADVPNHQIRWWRRPDPRGEDHIPDTHRTGSPRNRYMTWYEPAWRLRHDDNTRGVPAVLMRYVCEQWGTSYEGEDGTEVFQAGRPYHLWDDFGEPMRHDYDQENDWATNEGALRIRRSKRHPVGVDIETFGRHELRVFRPREDGWDRSDWVGCRIHGGMWSPAQVTSDGRTNGWDYEHLHVEELAFAAVACGSMLAHDSLRCLMNGLVAPGWGWQVWGGNIVKTPGALHSSRTLGWTLRAMARMAQVERRLGYDTPADNWTMTARELRSAVIDRWKNGLMPFWVPEDQRDAVILSRNRGAAHSGGQWIEEACWQAATVAEACWLWEEVDEDVGSAKWRLLGEEACVAARLCWQLSGGAGFAENVVVRGGQDPEVMGEVGFLGTRHWCLDPLAGSHNQENQDIAREAWQVLTSRTSYPTFRRNEHGWKWHQRCASLWGWGDE